ncbi:MAG: efflux RND transporter periplasmic adaptor subunit [Candidatus Paracaedimonas acanthamoebae]|uniref:Efflux RND transporter periplasmic adaptor subunit n=1 Tax=Candidatus Paracaedimonas acanthamoebae TaxID=244581 RepID=A0A8J7PJ54_9PROT|nr:efflux RND transporter periplasmic adaptor subunit [Candidatus Paracaedimonas acanthamoebae]
MKEHQMNFFRKQQILTLLKEHRVLATLLGLIILGVFSLIIKQFVLSDQKSRRQMKGVTVEIEYVRKASLTKHITTVGTLAANQIVTVKPQVSGLVSEIKVQGGSEVVANQVIMQIDDRQFKSNLKEEEAKLILAKAAHERASKLLEKKFGPAKSYDEALANLKAAESRVEIATKRVEDSQIQAPFEGIISLNNISIGAPVNEQTELFTIVDVDPMKLDFRVPAEYLRYISVGQTLAIIIDGFEDEPFSGTVEAIDAKVDPHAHSIAVRAHLSNQKRTLKPGLFARVDLVVGSKDNALVVPLSAVESSGDEEYVYKVFNGVAYRFPVTTGIQEGDNIEIVRGLQEGDVVVTVGLNKIRDGIPVVYEGMETDLKKEDDSKESKNTNNNPKEPQNKK